MYTYTNYIYTSVINIFLKKPQALATSSEKTIWDKNSLCRFLLHVLQAGFGCAAILQTLEEAYP